MKIGFLFPGQGAQCVGMGKDFYAAYPSVKAYYDAFPYRDVCFEGPKEKLDDTFYTQSCLLVTSLSIAQALKEEGIQADMAAGLSLGEYTALTYAGVFSFSDAVHIVSKRGELMANALEKGKTKMVAILGGDAQEIEQVCQTVSTPTEICTIANRNCPGQLVISGHNAAVDKACALLKEHCRRMVPLQVSGAFHSPLLKEAGKKLDRELKKVEIKNCQIPVVFNVSGQEETENFRASLVKQIQSTVYMQKSIETMLEAGVDHFVCIGPGRSMAGFVKKINRQIPVITVEKVEDIEKVKEWIHGE